jgi:glycosidase
MKDKPSSTWFNEWPNYTATNYRMSTWTDPHASVADRTKMTKGWFSTNMPDLNLNNALLFDYLTQVYIYWLEYTGIDGVRVDTYPYSDLKLAAQFIQTIRNEYPNINVVGECWANSPAEIAYFQSGNNNKDGFDSRLPSVMDFSLVKTLAAALNEEEGWSTGTARIYEHFATDFVYANTQNVMSFLDNHDLERFSTVLSGDVAKYKMALALLLTVRGYPQWYAGTEIMLTGEKGSYEGYRFDFPGGWATDARNAFTAEGRTAIENDIFNYCKTLLNFRKKSPALQQGKMMQFIPQDGIYVYFRYTDNQKVMVIVNTNTQSKTLALNRYNEMLQTSTSAFNVVGGELFMLQKTINVPAKIALVLEIN